MTRILTPLLAALLLASAPMAHAAPSAEAAAPAAAAKEIKVVYHINDASVARAAMNNVNTLLSG